MCWSEMSHHQLLLILLLLSLATADYNSLSVLTVNIQAYSNADRQTIRQAILDFKEKVDSLDVVGIQEDLLYNGLDDLPGYTKLVSCKAEKLDDDFLQQACRDTYMTGGHGMHPEHFCQNIQDGDYLANTLWVASHLLGDSGDSGDSDDSITTDNYPRSREDWSTVMELTTQCEVPRCVVAVTVKGLLVANTHLCGGNEAVFDDVEFRKLTGSKSGEVSEIIQHLLPDVIVGDFNAGRDSSIAAAKLSKYDLYQQLDEADKQLFLNDYYLSVHNLLQDNNYMAAYDEETIPRTSIYGSTVDWIYYSPRQISGVTVALTMPLMSVISTANTSGASSVSSQALSDHDGVYVRLQLK